MRTLRPTILTAAVLAALAGPALAQGTGPNAGRTPVRLSDVQMDRVVAGRGVTTSSFQNFDQKTNQLYNMLTQVVKTMDEMRSSSIKNML